MGPWEVVGWVGAIGVAVVIAAIVALVVAGVVKEIRRKPGSKEVFRGDGK